MLVINPGDKINTNHKFRATTLILGSKFCYSDRGLAGHPKFAFQHGRGIPQSERIFEDWGLILEILFRKKQT